MVRSELSRYSPFPLRSALHEQEYNICFSTVERPKDGAIAPLPPTANELAVLPNVLRRLVQRRRAVKDLLKTERHPLKKRQLDIRQQALKLTANSMYGCLGFANSRFYAKPLAELVTSQGREILQSTVDLVQSTLNLEVIYGDTDSIMINTASEDLAVVKKIGLAVKKEVNKRYKLLEIEMDGVFKSMLLLKKKKYAALKLDERPDGTYALTVEAKGLDIVRRDWSPLSKDIGNKVLNEILSGRPADDVVAAIHELLRSFRAKLEAGEVALDQFIITKALTKRPEDYPDGNSQPHVQVALRRIKEGKRDGVASGETVPYVICVEVAEGQGGTDAAAALAALATPPAGGKNLAERAYHPEEITKGATRHRECDRTPRGALHARHLRKRSDDIRIGRMWDASPFLRASFAYRRGQAGGGRVVLSLPAAAPGGGPPVHAHQRLRRRTARRVPRARPVALQGRGRHAVLRKGGGDARGAPRRRRALRWMHPAQAAQPRGAGVRLSGRRSCDGGESCRGRAAR